MSNNRWPYNLFDKHTTFIQCPETCLHIDHTRTIYILLGTTHTIALQENACMIGQSVTSCPAKLSYLRTHTHAHVTHCSHILRRVGAANYSVTHTQLNGNYFAMTALWLQMWEKARYLADKTVMIWSTSANLNCNLIDIHCDRMPGWPVMFGLVKPLWRLAMPFKLASDIISIQCKRAPYCVQTTTHLELFTRS